MTLSKKIRKEEDVLHWRVFDSQLEMEPVASGNCRLGVA